MAVTRVVILGAGIAGNALTVALNRHGIVPTVLEVTPVTAQGGFAVDLRGRSQEALRDWGVLDAVAACRLPEERMVAVRADGRVLWSSPASREGVVSDLEVGRSDLNRVLVRAGHADRRPGERAVRVEHHDDGERITTSSGATLDADLVVGADGARSPFRSEHFPDASVRDLGGSLAYVPVRYPHEFGGDMRALSVPGGAMVAIRPGRDHGYALIAVRRRGREPLPRDGSVQRAMIIDHLESIGAARSWYVPDVLEAVRRAPDFYCTSLERVTSPRWAMDRKALLGDAAWSGSPLTGRGTAMAIMGAAVLAQEIAGRPDDPSAAAVRYEQRMRSLRRWGHAHSRAGTLRAWAPSSRWQIDLNAFLMRTITGAMSRLPSTTERR